MTQTTRTAVAAALAAWLAAPALAAAPVAQTENGRVTGRYADGMREFLGIRYAAPPVGALRWQPPEPVPADLATHVAKAFGPHCAQSASPYGQASTNEDCLYLNVYGPKDLPAGKRLPVMFWIHGGALLVGESDDYDPKPLIARNDVLVVTINYRLGYFGYFAESGLDAEGHLAANYGLLDQQFALDWIRRNIAGFGGDPANMTVFGESAGGLSTLSNLVSPTAHGLFEGAIVESGAYAIHLPSLAEAEGAGDAVAQALGCAVGDTACLRNVSVSAVLAQEGNPNLSLTTIVDGTVLPASIDTALRTGRFNRVPLIDGSNHDEYRQFVVPYAGLTADQYLPALQAIFGTELGAAIAQKYPVGHYAQPVLALAAVLTDYSFACPARLVDGWASRYAPVYAYEFNDENAPQDFLPYAGYPWGAYHASEIQFLFDIPKLPGTPALSGAEQRLSRVMTGYWTDFARAGAPGGRGVPQWLPYSPGGEDVQSFVPPTAFPETDFGREHRCGFWATVIGQARAGVLVVR